MFVISEDVKRYAFFSYIPPEFNFDGLINEAELTFLLPALTVPLYQAIIADPGTYTDLIEQYIKPCHYFYTKYRYYNQIFHEGFNGSDGLNDIGNSHTALVAARYKMMVSIFKFAKAYELAMIEFIVQMNYPEYTAPDPPANPDPYIEQPPEPPPPEPPPPIVNEKLRCGFYIP